jgi:hypothetical protein
MFQNVYTDLGKAIGFLLFVLILYAVAGNKMTNAFLILVLLGQVITHPEVIKKIPFFGGK